MKISIIGTGKVANHLFKALTEASLPTGASIEPAEQSSSLIVEQINSRTLAGLSLDSDLYLLAVTDAAIPAVAAAITPLLPQRAAEAHPESIEVGEASPSSPCPPVSRTPAGSRGASASLPIVAHTSGTTPISALAGCGAAQGVFYPLQTFSHNRDLDYSKIPFFIEGSNEETTRILTRIARSISHSVTLADSEKRKALHIAAVFACNFTNHLYTLAAEHMQANGLEFATLLPLIEETVAKLHTLTPAEAQTGPAARADHPTIAAHLAALKATEEASKKASEKAYEKISKKESENPSEAPKKSEIYTLLTSSILSRREGSPEKKGKAPDCGPNAVRTSLS